MAGILLGRKPVPRTSANDHGMETRRAHLQIREPEWNRAVPAVFVCQRGHFFAAVTEFFPADRDAVHHGPHSF